MQIAHHPREPIFRLHIRTTNNNNKIFLLFLIFFFLSEKRSVHFTFHSFPFTKNSIQSHKFTKIFKCQNNKKKQTLTMKIKFYFPLPCSAIECVCTHMRTKKRMKETEPTKWKSETARTELEKLYAERMKMRESRESAQKSINVIHPSNVYMRGTMDDWVYWSKMLKQVMVVWCVFSVSPCIYTEKIQRDIFLLIIFLLFNFFRVAFWCHHTNG